MNISLVIVTFPLVLLISCLKIVKTYEKHEGEKTIVVFLQFSFSWDFKIFRDFSVMFH